MSKNEYRRAFIMLRPAVPGWSGHVRLERRTMTGTMYFIVSAPDADAAPFAALAGQRGGEYFAEPLGALRRDSRGQWTLACAFDPRRIGAWPLDAYQQLAVAAQDGESGCRVVLTGNVDGAYPMDAAAVSEAVCALSPVGTPADDLPAPGETANDGTPEGSGARDDDMQDGDMQDGGTTDAPDSQAPEPSPDTTPADDTGPAEPAQDMEAQSGTGPAEPAQDAVAQDSAGPADSETPSATRIYTRMRRPAALTETVAPAAAENPGHTGAPGPQTTDPPPAPAWMALAEENRATACAMPLEDGYAYVRVPLPQACGYGYGLVGVRLDGGRLASVRFALPGSYAPRPPEGLAGGVWVGAGDGSGAGYWVTTARCADG